MDHKDQYIVIIPETIQQYIIRLICREISKEFQVSTGRASAAFTIRCDSRKEQVSLSLVSHYWFNQISKLFTSVESITSSKHNEQIWTVYDLIHRQIRNPHNLLSFQSHLILSYSSSYDSWDDFNYDNVHLSNGFIQRPLYHRINGELVSEQDIYHQRKEFYKQYYRNLKELMLDACVPPTVDLTVFYQDIIAIANESPSLDYFELDCTIDFILNASQEVIDSLIKLGITKLAMNVYQRSLTNTEVDRMVDFFSKIKNKLTTFQLDSYDSELKLLLLFKLISLINYDDPLKRLYVDAPRYDPLAPEFRYNNTQISDILDKIYTLDFDDISLDFVNSSTEQNLLIRNSITTYSFCPLYMIPFTKSTTIQINMEQVKGLVRYSKSIKMVELLNVNPISVEQLCWTMDDLKSFQSGLDYLIILKEIDIDYLCTFIKSQPKIKYLVLDYNFTGNDEFYKALSENTSLFAIQIIPNNLKERDRFITSISNNNTLKYIVIRTKTPLKNIPTQYTISENHLYFILLKNKNYYQYPPKSRNLNSPTRKELKEAKKKSLKLSFLKNSILVGLVSGALYYLFKK